MRHKGRLGCGLTAKGCMLKWVMWQVSQEQRARSVAGGEWKSIYRIDV
ncbi:hypothetical protein BC938DRAFT_471050, partial [Jimgerdemannia flammicorona]